MIRALVFLGNPGLEYSRTRHNAGWMLIPFLPHAADVSWQRKFKGEYAVMPASLGGAGSLHLLKPLTMMNLSGESVRALSDFLKLRIDEILVVHDDIELGFGEVGHKLGGGAAGHNGLRSIVQVLGKNDFHRFRIGVGRPSRGTVASFVLAAFDRQEQRVLDVVMQKAAENLVEILRRLDRRKSPGADYRRILVL